MTHVRVRHRLLLVGPFIAAALTACPQKQANTAARPETSPDTAAELAPTSHEQALLSAGPPDLAAPHFDAVRDLFEAHCGECHRPDGEYAFDLPLSLYTLVDKDPLRRLSDAQLAEAYRRFDEQNPPAADLKRLVTYFSAEVARRDGDAQRYPLAARAAAAADAVITPRSGCMGAACFSAFETAFSGAFGAATSSRGR